MHMRLWRSGAAPGGRVVEFGQREAGLGRWLVVQHANSESTLFTRQAGHFHKQSGFGKLVQLNNLTKKGRLSGKVVF
jgi:hypothetical protein